MSVIWTVRCPSCDEIGPKLQRSAGGVGFFGQRDQWHDFLSDHGIGHGPLILVDEGAESDALSAVLHRIVARAAVDPDPPIDIKVNVRSGLVSVGTLWQATGRPRSEVENYANLDAIVEEMLGWLRAGSDAAREEGG